MSCAWEKLYQAVDDLVTCEKPLRKCLVDVCTNSLNTLDESDFPEQDQKDDFRRFIESITKCNGVGSEGKVQATISKMNNYEVLEVVEKILSFYDKVPVLPCGQPSCHLI